MIIRLYKCSSPIVITKKSSSKSKFIFISQPQQFITYYEFISKLITNGKNKYIYDELSQIKVEQSYILNQSLKIRDTRLIKSVNADLLNKIIKSLEI